MQEESPSSNNQIALAIEMETGKRNFDKTLQITKGITCEYAAAKFVFDLF